MNHQSQILAGGGGGGYFSHTLVERKISYDCQIVFLYLECIRKCDI